MECITITRPDDWHVHFRDGDYLKDTVPATAQHFSRALVMPNLKPALTTIHDLIDYQQRILSALPKASTFSPYMTIYLNESVTAEELARVKHYPSILGAKLYPAGATTNSEAGVNSLRALYPLFEVMQTEDLVLQIHGETTQGDIFHREAAFIDNDLMPLIRNFPKLRIILEHISTKAAVEFIQQAPDTVAATVTVHHLMYNRNHLLAGGIKPHYYCLPILKRDTDQHALRTAAVSGNPKFFAGTDSAPHAVASKQSACGCAGIFSAPYAVALYAQVFEELNGLHKLDAFLSRFGAEFYQLPFNKEQLTLKKSPQLVPAILPFGADKVIPIAAGETLPWSIHDAA
ncbi:dihydroorotase [Legionella jamestowniensis]|uniref:Dihydroorotase n=1 Tax=Legionella jamestowniensis TaxID=455 RepID=A0A0W0UI90_9GAMM|nr:dihydroorotase [Legionella jamestowniensis]KTD07614.1 dihydroorotase, homodimeric type [Legionella jamestowniensis]OCH99544.1 dihydroorotase [Legionella jamestowniensis]SFL59455.1 dihydroorotase [Legionella jamestowniensis DSM 19215]